MFFFFLYSPRSLPSIGSKTPPSPTKEDLFTTADENEVFLLQAGLGLQSLKPRALSVCNTHGVQKEILLKQQVRL